MGDGGNESVAVTAGFWGFVVLFGLAIACWLLFRSMNNHLRKSQWQEEQDHPVRQRIPTAPRRATEAEPTRSKKAADRTDPGKGDTNT
ncbi:hypothetical protein GCM10011492_42530 [Flexivirga endophytica]|uniref:Uncharacterized protein n=1 Tax=Flexivirga endophytica TaxID=1849103 RepID=A0A916X0A7_9MICO|nr:hypothetical protein [Flexivirga endophytica]GGB46898.1 hypothetical protein GCM10011492_42530 [Flexivirga endophytica]GHB67648.1 hypothetical protein GCM10008112_40640 [Flexivirga endophytica]